MKNIHILPLFITASIFGQDELFPMKKMEEAGDKITILDKDLDKDGLYTCIFEINDIKKVKEGLGSSLVLRNRKNEKVGVIQITLAEFDGKGISEIHLNDDMIFNSEILYQIFPNTDKMAIVKVRLGQLGYYKRVDGNTTHFEFK